MPAAQRGADSSHLLDYIRVLLKRLWLILGFFILVVGVVGFATWRATPVYRAAAIIDLRPPASTLGRFDPAAFIQSVNRSSMRRNTQYALLQQRATIQRMVQDKGLEKWPEFKDKSSGEIVGSIVGRIQVAPRRETSLVYVSVESEDRNTVHKLTNALVETFKEYQAEDAQAQIDVSLNALETEWTENRNKAQLQSNQIGKLLEQNDTDRETFLQSFGFQQEEIQTLQKQVSKLETQLAGLKPNADLIRKAKEQGNGAGLTSLFGHPLVTENPRISEYEKSLLLKFRRLQAFEAGGAGPNRPQVIELRRMIEDDQALMEMEKENILNGYLENYLSLEQTLEITKGLRDESREGFREMSMLKRRYDAYEEQVKRYEDEGERYYVMWEKVSGSRERRSDPVRIVDRARQPFAPVSPDKQLNMILAIVFGLLGGIGIAFFLEYMDDTIKTKEELERITKVPLFGVIPNISARRAEVSKKDLFAYDQPKSTISEAFRGIRTALSYSSQKQENRIYLVTSGGPKEGKTTIAINVATVMAYSGTRTLLVDCDLRKPRVHRSFDLPNTKGLSNAIIGETPLTEVIQQTHVENLDVLPSGPIPPNPSELLGRERMVEILEELRTMYDRILLDTPPIGAVTDGAVLGRIVDSVILVIHAGKTRKKLIERALEQLGQIDVDVSGVVLNNLKIGRKRYYPGYYHYYYYYSSYYGSDEKAKSKGRNKDKSKGKAKG